ncbi:MAG: DNA repair protein RecN [Dehalococcoidia bacterium]
MLLELKVKNLGVIGEVNWSLGSGLNVVTGETGAGKSLVVEAMDILLGKKVDDTVVRSGADRAQIEGVFLIPQTDAGSRLGEFLSDKGVEVEEGTLVLSREVRREGRSVSRVNGQALSAGLISQIGRFLSDIHAQSEHLSLLDRRSHLDFLDAYAGVMETRRDFAAKASELYRMEQELASLRNQEKDMARREDYLRFQIDEITSANLYEGEEEELERERDILSSVEKLKSLSHGAYEQLYGGDNSGSSALDRLNEAVGMVKELVNLDPGSKERLDRLESSLYEVEDIAQDIRSYSEGLEYSPERLEEIQSRLELIRDLKRKYGKDIGEVLEYLERAKQELEGISHSSERRIELEQENSRLKQNMAEIASRLSESRRRAASTLAEETRKELQDLNLSKVEFEVEITQEPDEQGLLFPDGESYAFSSDGVDSVQFMASTNPGEPLKPLAKIASTGEISRFMLALKGALSRADDTPVLVFDEVDIGVGGRGGEMIGKKLWTLARDRQVICISHLSQIAAFADAHYTVRKEVADTQASSTLKSLDGQPRLAELAAMLAGPQYTETALENARELLERAGEWKSKHV